MNIKAFPTEVTNGMDLRDYFAAKAMQSLCQAWISTDNNLSFSEVAKASYNAADAMMEARKK